MNIDWGQAAAFLTVVTVGGGLAFWVMRSAMHGAFVDGKAFGALEKRVVVVEARMARCATYEDVQIVAARLQTVEVGQAQLSAQVAGVHDGVGRLERMVDILLKNELGEKAGELGASR